MNTRSIILLALLAPSAKINCLAQVVDKVAPQENRGVIGASRPVVISAPLVAIRFEPADSNFFVTVTAAGEQRIEESPIDKDFESFKKKTKPTYLDEPQGLIPPKVNSPLAMRFGGDVNTNDPSNPLDNTLAVSPDGQVISITNKYIEFWEKDKLVFRQDLASFFGYKIDSPCDPKVIYDPQEQRFIIFAQSCGGFTDSRLILVFSTSKNPRDPWNFYVLSGNPEGKENHWFDYPKIGLSTSGLFIGGNIFHNKKFVKTVVYQVDKQTGFSGQGLNYVVWADFPDSPTVLMPISHAYDRLYGPGIYLVGTTFQNGAKYIRLYEITGPITDTGTTIKFYKVATDPYFFFAKAVQMNESIDNGDLRIQDGVYRDGVIYFVFTSGDSRQLSRVNLNALEIKNLKNRSVLLGDEVNGFYAYPSLGLIADGRGEDHLVVHFNSTSSKTYPSMNFNYCDKKLNCIGDAPVATGISLIKGSDRWGDYAGTSISYGASKGIWLSSSYGSGGFRQAFLANYVMLDSGKVAEPVSTASTVEFESLEFKVKDGGEIKVVLKSGSGQRELAREQALKGKNELQLSTFDLQKGIYTLEIRDAKTNQLLKDKVIIKSDMLTKKN